MNFGSLIWTFSFHRRDYLICSFLSHDWRMGWITGESWFCLL